MIIYKIPGRDDIEIENIVFDYNGTIAVDGKLLEGVRDLLLELGKHVNIYILTADTYGTVEKECRNIAGKVLNFPKENAGEFKEAIISIAVIEGEGASTKLLLSADIVTRSIIEAIEIILNENKLKAILRN